MNVPLDPVLHAAAQRLDELDEYTLGVVVGMVCEAVGVDVITNPEVAAHVTGMVREALQLAIEQEPRH